MLQAIFLQLHVIAYTCTSGFLIASIAEHSLRCYGRAKNVGRGRARNGNGVHAKRVVRDYRHVARRWIAQHLTCAECVVQRNASIQQ